MYRHFCDSPIHNDDHTETSCRNLCTANTVFNTPSSSEETILRQAGMATIDVLRVTCPDCLAIFNKPKNKRGRPKKTRIKKLKIKSNEEIEL